MFASPLTSDTQYRRGFGGAGSPEQGDWGDGCPQRVWAAPTKGHRLMDWHIFCEAKPFLKLLRLRVGRYSPKGQRS